MHLARLQLSPPHEGSSAATSAAHSSRSTHAHIIQAGLASQHQQAPSSGLLGHISFDTFTRSPPAHCGYFVDTPQEVQPLPTRAYFRTAIKRMHADLQALLQHGEDLGIDSDPIRVSHAYNAHLEAVFAGSIEPTCEEQDANTRSLHFSSSNPNANFATSSGLYVGSSTMHTLPGYASFADCHSSSSGRCPPTDNAPSSACANLGQSATASHLPSTHDVHLLGQLDPLGVNSFECLSPDPTEVGTIVSHAKRPIFG